MKQTDSGFQPVRALEVTAQSYLLSENGQWILFTHWDTNSGKVTFTVCDTATLQPRWQTTLEAADKEAGIRFQPLAVHPEGKEVLLYGDSGLGDREKQFFLLCAPEKD